ncbi:MAG: hypothetical protein ACE364_07130 [Chlorobiota bacterium]
MKLLIYILIGIIFTNSLHAIENELKMYCEKLDYNYLEKKLDSLKESSNNVLKYVWHVEIEREIVNDYSEGIIIFDKHIVDTLDNAVFYGDTYKIRYIKNINDKLIFCELAQKKYKGVEDDWIEYEVVHFKDSTEEIMKFKSDFKSIYSIPINMDGLFSTKIAYGWSCGFIGKPPLYRKKLDSLLKNQNREELINWVGSPTLEIQFYAIEGILTLEKEGVQFESNVKEMIKIISEKEGFIKSCSGCMSRSVPIDQQFKYLIKDVNEYNRTRIED